ncbi:MAG: fatty acid hydroxylase [Methylothermaceae bacteria B42]|nr:MAG: fatty acid hydroxylase [Methylothermaceae bacteria B42]HHJ38902.1 sterol desaturase family protein [Methylothermaceae bacterium]
MPIWQDWILSHEIFIRLGCFALVLVLMILWETLLPRRQWRDPRPMRWLNNLGLALINNLLVRLLFPMAAVGVAAFAEHQGWGLLRMLSMPPLGQVMIAVVVLDLIIYLQHVMFHALPALWRLHRVHHADVDFDVTTGIRFHPLEILISLGIKATAIVLLGVPVVAVVLFEVLLNATAMFNHGNVSLPAALDRVLRWLIVTPDMHRVHHSIADDEANCNFGFNLPWWDRLLGTYRAQPRRGHERMTIGIHGIRQRRQVLWLPGMLLLPFSAPITGYVINRRKGSRDE